VSIFSRLFGRRQAKKGAEGCCVRAEKKPGDCCIKCGKRFSSPHEVKDPRLGLARFPGDIAGVIAGAAAICAVPAHVCPQCGGKICLGCVPMRGSPTCPKCNCQMNRK